MQARGGEVAEKRLVLLDFFVAARQVEGDLLHVMHVAVADIPDPEAGGFDFVFQAKVVLGSGSLTARRDIDITRADLMNELQVVVARIFGHLDRDLDSGRPRMPARGLLFGMHLSGGQCRTGQELSELASFESRRLHRKRVYSAGGEVPPGLRMRSLPADFRDADPAEAALGDIPAGGRKGERNGFEALAEDFEAALAPLGFPGSDPFD